MKKGLKRGLIIGGSVLGVVVLVVVGLVFNLFYKFTAPVTAQWEDDEPITVAATPEPTIDPSAVPEVAQSELTDDDMSAIAENQDAANVINVLLLGVDRRGSSGMSRTDTMIIATLDKKNNRLKMTSIMRDLYVPIPGRETARLNSAGAYGGPELLMQTLNENFSLNIEKYVLVDFRMFEKIVDKMGGVTLYVHDSEVSAANDCIAGLNKERGAVTQEEIWRGFISHGTGNKKLNGKQALGYSRIRHMGSGDFARVTRQYKVLQAIFQKFIDLGVTKQYALLDEMLPMVETNMGAEVFDIMISTLALPSKEILIYRMPVDGHYKSATIGGSAVLVPDIPANTLALHNFLYNVVDQPPETADTNTNGRYVPPVVEETPLPDELPGDVPIDGDPEATPPPIIPEWPLPSVYSEPVIIPTPAPGELPQIG